jgi:hypothetical protein
MFHWWMSNLIKAVLAGILFVIGYVAYWVVKDKEFLGSKRVIPVMKPKPAEDYGTPVAPI